MAEDKKTKQELEVQAKIANDFKLARNEADLALKASYSAEIQALLAECSKYNGVTQLTEVGKRLDKAGERVLLQKNGANQALPGIYGALFPHHEHVS